MSLTSLAAGPAGGRRMVLVVLAFGAAAVLATRRGRPAPAQEPTCVSADGYPCQQVTAAVPGAVAPAASPVVPADRACRDAAYLCSGFRERGENRVMRWADGTREIRVLIPLPHTDDPSRDRDLQEAAARGVRAWDGHPFPIRVELRGRDTPSDITVRWASQLGGTELGRTSTRWRRIGTEATLLVDELSLATRSPYDATRELGPRQVELTAAHEMGHALGLPHSDDPHDVMYPTNTASALSARDYRAMEVLYRLPNGVEIAEE